MFKTKTHNNIELTNLLVKKGYSFEIKNNHFCITHQGYVDLRSLTTLPEGVKFENQGSVDLESLTTPFVYRNKTITLKTIDGLPMLLDSKKQKGEFEIVQARYFGGGPLNKLKKCYIATRGEFHAHGDSIKEAINDVNFKFLQENLDTKKLVKEIKQKQTVNINEYRLLTGACSAGVNAFIANRGLQDKDKLPLSEVLSITQGHYGGSRMQELFT